MIVTANRTLANATANAEYRGHAVSRSMVIELALEKRRYGGVVEITATAQSNFAAFAATNDRPGRSKA